jgi:hypothetical protein
VAGDAARITTTEVRTMDDQSNPDNPASDGERMTAVTTIGLNLGQDGAPS